MKAFTRDHWGKDRLTRFIYLKETFNSGEIASLALDHFSAKLSSPGLSDIRTSHREMVSYFLLTGRPTTDMGRPG